MCCFPEEKNKKKIYEKICLCSGVRRRPVLFGRGEEDVRVVRVDEGG